MHTFSKVIVASVFSLVLSLAVLNPGAFAQRADYGAVRSALVQPTGSAQLHDGPSPVYNGYGNGDNGGNYGGGGYNGGGYGGGNYGGGGYNGGGNYGGGGYNGGGYGGGNYGGGWHHSGCSGYHCGHDRRAASRCVRLTREMRSHLELRRAAYQFCRWISAERW